MKNKYITIGLIFIMILTTVFIVFRMSRHIDEDIELRNQIIETIEQSDSINFTEITNLKWDTMYVFTPYSNPNDILKADGAKSYNSNFSIEYLDHINMIAFVKSNKLVSFVELPRQYCDSIRTIKLRDNEAELTISQKDKVLIFDNK